MTTLTRPKYDFTPHLRIKRATHQTSMSMDHHLQLVEREFNDWLTRHKWKAQAKEFRRLCKNIRNENLSYTESMDHIEYFINLTIEGLGAGVARRIHAT